MEMRKLDRYDRALIHQLQRDGRMSLARLSETVHLSESACGRRLRALERSGLIEGYTAQINQTLAGLPVTVFVNITLCAQGKAELAAFEEAARAVPQILECYLMTGEHDYMVRIAVSEMTDFERIHYQVLTRLPGVVRVHSSITIRTIKRVQPTPAEGLQLAVTEED